jgi:glycerol-3-phosphate dehydrogenase
MTGMTGEQRQERGSRLRPLAQATFDLVIVGGGIIGAGIARDAALRGLSVALVEQADYGSGTTSGSTRLIHGGLRYLEMFDFPLVRLDLREREILLRIAPHLVRPLEFLLPFYDESRFARWRLGIGMWLYDALSYDKSLPRHRSLSAADVRTIEPTLESKGLKGGAAYFDAQASMPERLCLENIIDARAHGAVTANYARAIGAVHEGGRLVGVRVEDALGEDDAVDVRGRVIVNASGAWLDRLFASMERSAASAGSGEPGRLRSASAGQGAPGRAPRPRLRTTKGIHITCPPTTSRALAVPSAVDGRLVFVIPWLGHSWIGTTDTDFEDDPARARATGDDVRYVQASVGRYVPALASAPIYFTNAGVRALVRQEGRESSVSRSHRLLDGDREGMPGLVAVVGGKLTGYRAIAEETTDLVCAKLGSRAKAVTAERPLPGAGSPIDPGAWLPALHLAAVYGSRISAVADLAAADPVLAEPFASDYPDVGAQAVLAVRDEQCVRLSDFMLRRTRLGFSRDQGRQAVPAVARLLARALGWTAARHDAELADYAAHVDWTQRFRSE